MSRTAITQKFKMSLFLDEARYWAEKLLIDINLPPLMPVEDNNFDRSLGIKTSRATQELTKELSMGSHGSEIVKR